MDEQQLDDIAVTVTPTGEPDDVTAAAPLRWGTVSVWILAFMPWVSAAGFAAAPWTAVSSHYADWVWAAVLVVPYLVTVAVAGLDVWRLCAWQHPTVASWAWALLGAPVYLVARSMTVRLRARRALLPMWVGLANAAASLVVVAITAVVLVGLAFWFLTMLAESLGAPIF